VRVDAAAGPLDRQGKVNAMAITFTVKGEPVPQPRAKISTIGGRGRAYVEASHPIHAYRQAIALMAKAAGATPTDAAPLTLEIELVMVRPKSHYRANGELNPRTARKLPRGDCSNYQKGIEDALNGVAWVDDDQVGRTIVEKTYGLEARTTVRIT
jgi:Holliday junction resolvase RusA-like endonuclease